MSKNSRFPKITLSKKAAISLPINLLVTIIISLVILGLGVTLLYQFIGEAEKVKKDLDQKTSEELEHLLVDQGKRVALPLSVAYLNPGENHIFGIGILNIGTTDSFQIEVALSDSDAVDNSGPLSPEEKDKANDWLLYHPDAIEIKENQHVKEGIMVDVPKDAWKGQYIFNVIIRNAAGNQYGNTQKFYVNVK